MADKKPLFPPADSPYWKPPKRRKRFVVRRIRTDKVEAMGETDVFRFYSVRGIVSDTWETATVKVSALRLDRQFDLVLRWPAGGLITAEVRLAFSEGVMRLLDEKGKTTYSRIQNEASEDWGVVYLPLHDADESKALMRIAANPMRLGGWALERLRPLIIGWAEEHL